MLNRKNLVSRHNPILTKPDTRSPLTIGNGGFAFTADITGLQTLYNEYTDAPLCAMSSWGWHSRPGSYTLDDVKKTVYTYEGRKYEYAVEQYPETAEAYDWLRQNPHRLNLARVMLIWDNKEIHSSAITDIEQELDLYTGVLTSEFRLHGQYVKVRTVCAGNSDTLGFSITSADPKLSVRIDFPYGSHKKNASDWQNNNGHKTTEIERGKEYFLLERTLDSDKYYVEIMGAEAARTGEHSYKLTANSCTLRFSAEKPVREKPENRPKLSFDDILSDSKKTFENFWQTGGIADFSAAKDSRAKELERRTILSMYLTYINSAGRLPPQETGLTCNSWYGKFHLEMHILHTGWLPLWGRSHLLEKSFGWYLGILDKARENAGRNGFAGARWPKMVGPEGIDCPSRIATLLIWQQPHILYMLELARLSRPPREQAEFCREYWNIVRETADFMADFAKIDNTGKYNLTPPLIPAQEEHRPEISLNPAFELCYWHFGLDIAINWASVMGADKPRWGEVRDNLAKPPISDGLYQAHQNAPDTFTKFNRDHPSMLYGYGFIPSAGIDKEAMNRTVDKVLSCWDFSTGWGWDFALMAMTLTRLGRPEDALDVLLYDTPKNTYVASGNNYQRGRDDLPLYLPGNGSLLFCLPMMLAGYGNIRNAPGLPENGMWEVRHEGILPLPY